jgi:hypothetical protein
MTPVPLGEGVGQVIGLAAPDVDPEEGGVAVAPFAVLLDALSHRDSQVGDAVRWVMPSSQPAQLIERRGEVAEAPRLNG